MDGVFVPGRRKKSKISRQEIIPAARPYAKTLRGPERPVDCGGTLSRFRRQGLVRARAAPRERNGGAGRWGRGRRPGEDIVREGPWRRETSKNGKKVKDEPKDSYRDIFVIEENRASGLLLIQRRARRDELAAVRGARKQKTVLSHARFGKIIKRHNVTAMQCAGGKSTLSSTVVKVLQLVGL